MKNLCTGMLILMSFLFSSNVFAQREIPATDTNRDYSAPPSVADEFKISGLTANRVKLFWGIHSHLLGYADQRYIGDDQGDYKKVFVNYYGIELIIKRLLVPAQSA